MINVPQIIEETFTESAWPITPAQAKQYVKQTLNLPAEDDVIEMLISSSIRSAQSYTDQLMITTGDYTVRVEVEGYDEEEGATIIPLPYGGGVISNLSFADIEDAGGEDVDINDYPYIIKGRKLIFKNQDLAGFTMKLTYTAARSSNDQFKEPILAVFAEKYVNRNEQNFSKIMEILGPYVNYELWA